MGTKPSIAQQIEEKQHEIREALNAVGWSLAKLAKEYILSADDQFDSEDYQEEEKLAESIKKALQRKSNSPKMLTRISMYLECIHHSRDWKNKGLIKLHHVPSAKLPASINEQLAHLSKALDSSLKDTHSSKAGTSTR